MLERDFQGKFIKWLKDAYVGRSIVVKNQANPGVPQGFPDVCVFYSGGFIALEFKRSSNAPYRPNQEHYLRTLNGYENGRSFTVSPENADWVKSEIKRLFRQHK